MDEQKERDLLTVAAVGRLLVEDCVDMDGLLTKEENERLYVISEDVPDEDEDDNSVAKRMFREAVDRLLNAEVLRKCT